MEDNKEVKVEKTGRSTKSKVVTIFLGVALLCTVAILIFVLLDNGTLFGRTKCNVPMNTNDNKEPVETNDIIKSVSSNGYMLYETNNGFYLSVTSNENNNLKEYVIGNQYVKAYKVSGDSYSDIDYIFQGNGGNGLFLFYESNDEADISENEAISYKLSFINLDNFDANETVTPKTNDKLAKISYVYKECKRGGCSAIAVTKTGEKIDLYNITN